MASQVKKNRDYINNNRINIPNLRYTSLLNGQVCMYLLLDESYHLHVVGDGRALSGGSQCDAQVHARVIVLT